MIYAQVRDFYIGIKIRLAFADLVSWIASRAVQWLPFAKT
jgi:hypothetical protein